MQESNDMINPYYNSLDGLKLKDPVEAFFNFCKERENIRSLRENGEPFPWTKDLIFQRGRFLNVFREDDRVSKAILNFAKELKYDLPMLIHAVFFARWCNKQETLDKLSANMLIEPKKLYKKLKYLDNWCNLNAYPVEQVDWKGIKHSRLDTAVKLFFNIKKDLLIIINNSEGDVIKATISINKKLKMKNDFPIFMAIMDLAWFRPDIIYPNSRVPTGIGAVAFLDILQKYLGLNNHHEVCEKMIELQKKYWPEAKREFQPIDIEYLSCECRKYYSYVNGTKLFEGKNIFKPQ